MNLFLKKRLQKKMIGASLLIGVVICMLQFYQVINNYLLYGMDASRIFSESPYTTWIGIDPFNFSPSLFFLLIPIIASVPTATLLRQDINNRFIVQLKLRKSLKQVIWSYAIVAFISGFIVIAVPLLINFGSYFFILPNVKPDDMINSNLTIMNKNTLLVSLYYTHPFFHALLAIIFASFWGGIFSLFTFASSLFIKNKFVALCSGLILQIILLLVNSMLKLPKDISYAPFNFLKEMNNANIDISTVLTVTIFMIAVCLALIKWGGKRSIVK
ncbi:hypothetical protein QYH60_13275 (plasmid) [Lactococcus lactis subsp. lactis]|uniref:hypothetical protein n=1 Tax=Lactococcus lactis TaxID=1358 RepID=UPI0026484147|nr:hypothetical protein [Lactococcus lactis]WKB49919.1 hypothetical protein QYH60_13275 [Lactococcus lactis subsp. lactis]